MQTPRRILVQVTLAFALVAACAKDSYPHLYRTQPLAPGYADADVAALAHLGSTRVQGGVNFGVYSASATRIELALFDDPESTHPTRQFLMTRFGEVWNLYVEGIGLGQAYGFIAWGPNWTYDPNFLPGKIDGFVADVDALGNRFDPNKLLFDPYSRAFHRLHDWSKGSTASGPKRTEATYAAAAKSVVVESTYSWSDNEAKWRTMRQDANAPGHRWNDLILYEVHPKGFTADPASAVEHPGTFLGLAEKADYLKDLGITAVELMPVFQKPSDGGYWGYQTIGFFAPELTFSSRQLPGQPIDEFKYMVDQLHQRGLEVVLDVVYNHTGEGGLWRNKIASNDVSADPSVALYNFDAKEVAGIYSFRGLDNAGYYALSDDKQTYDNSTGVGDATRCNNAPMQRLIADSLRFWATEMHVDGFRFDLAPVLGEPDLSYRNFDATHTVLQSIIDDPVLQRWNTRIIAEPWSLNGTYLSQFPASTTKPGTGWSEWNGRFRDWWRAFVNFDGTSGNISSCNPMPCTTPYWSLNSQEGGVNGGFLMTGSYDWFHGSGRRPYNSINFITVHDGFTLYDLLTYPQKQNRCGPLNPVCCDTPNSPFCDTDSGESNNRSRDWGGGNEAFKRTQMRNLFTAMMIAHGTPMLLGGDEWMRTQLGNNNAYSTLADNPFNWFDWGTWEANDDRARMHDFVRKLLRFRTAHTYALSPDDYGSGAPFTWKNEQDTTPPDWNSKHLAMHYYDASAGPQLLVLINMETATVNFTLPTGVHWQRLLDTQAYFEGVDRISGNIELDAPAAIAGPAYGVQDHSIVILQAAAQ